MFTGKKRPLGQTPSTNNPKPHFDHNKTARRSGPFFTTWLQLQIFAVDLGHALQFLDVLGHAGVLVVEVVASCEFVEAWLVVSEQGSRRGIAH